MVKDIQHDIEKCHNDVKNLVIDPKIKEKLPETRWITRKSKSPAVSSDCLLEVTVGEQKDPPQFFQFEPTEQPDG
jgi:hypothetical protein